MRPQRERGQATVEFALIIPLVLLAVLIVIQVGLVAYSQLAVTHLAREVARSLSVDPDADPYLFLDKMPIAETNGLVIEAHFEMGSTGERGLVVVSVTHQSSAIIALFEPFSDHFTARAQAIMLLE